VTILSCQITRHELVGACASSQSNHRRRSFRFLSSSDCICSCITYSFNSATFIYSACNSMISAYSIKPDTPERPIFGFRGARVVRPPVVQPNSMSPTDNAEGNTLIREGTGQSSHATPRVAASMKVSSTNGVAYACLAIF